MSTNPQIREALLERLGVTPQRLSQLVKARKNDLPMNTEQAVYTIAHEQGIDIAKHLSKEETAEVRQLVSGLRARGAQEPAAPKGRQTLGRTKPKPVLVSIAGFPEANLPGMTATHAKEAKLMAERVYPKLYLFENSLRDVIERVLKATYGIDWWTKAVPKKVRDRVAEHKAAESKDPWHGKRGNRELDYLLLSQLWDIIKHQWKQFAPLFPNQAWIEGLITNDMNVSRRVVAHMNPLADDDVKNIEAAFNKWGKQLRAIEDQLP